MNDPAPDLLTQAREAVRRRGRATSARVRVLAHLLGAPTALSHADLEAALGGRVDRVTLYRSLDWLITQGLAHRIAGEDRVWRYGAASVSDARAAAHAEHAHFHCQACARVYCLPELQPVFALSLPPGFHIHKAALTLHGFCPRCSG